MERNIQNDGTAEDLIRSVTQLACAELHAKTLLEKFTAELENGIVDIDDQTSVDKQIEKIQDVTEEINEIAELRRATQLALFNLFPDGDKNFWCMVKHEATASYTLFEAYQASGNTQLLTLALEANKRFIKTLSHFLGTEITECAACFSDMIKKGERHNE